MGLQARVEYRKFIFKQTKYLPGRLSYRGYNLLREKMAPQVGFGYIHRDNDILLESYDLYPDEALKEFFLSSDVDAEFSYEECRYLYEKLKDTSGYSKHYQPLFDIFMGWLQSAIELKGTLHFN